MDLPLHAPAQLRAHLKALRKASGLTQTELARRLGIKQARMADIEKHPELISTAQFIQVLAALGVEVLLRQKSTSPERPAPKGDW
ncbi:MAG TPA: helix-turn-helix domain-containing protein [Povalibacter sp.]|mgnify:CR=1 FL=1|uniref:helix-turn-helix domain-containing protein n=1 Tax=Povalibacter sp. TaxID=1962978 RepID=UPI002C31CDD2|nr:helix-turn-helix domain-containing protein [Povalibacter sp.]HMN43810.1 helix-turn-helix domain-containing protein [Povalibacter sp.]